MLSAPRAKRVLLLASAAVVAAASIAYGLADSDDAGGPPLAISRADVEMPTTAVPAVEDAVVDHFALFRERAASPMPDAVARQVGSPRRFGRNADLARAIETTNGTGWVIPGRGYLCIAVPDPVDGYGTTCAATEVAVHQGLWLRMGGTRPDGKVADTTLAPDGTRTIDQASGADVATELGVSSRLVEPSTATVVLAGGR